ncbi:MULTISPECIES: RCC1 domain-containing protein [Paenibacillus]|uniref:hypothetical protein n=1 Tax=Paenibacillus TaxID=44249 RepID=UPI0022B8D226|nr:hypothetical protein [Paenibacillus caseinilyticus]MCZ8518337.1 hypothetical protein [Paenibacillus caseinilyticus]
MEGLSDIQSIAVSTGSYYALKKDGSVWAWGHKEGGQLGDGTNKNKTSPVRIESLHNQVKGLTHIKKISASSTSYAVSALKEDGTLWV